jgi:photosystem II stability/assembly factor-like uncharacterized protein
VSRFDRVIQILDAAIGGPNVNIAVHGAFWRGLTRQQFVEKKVQGLDLLVVGNGAASNLIKALKGEVPFGADLEPPPAGALYDRMPSGLNSVADEDIAVIAKWIDDGCPPTDDAQQSPPVNTDSSAGLSDALQWHATNAPVASSRTDDIWFSDPQTGWAVNSNGQIVKTIDGFNTYVEQLHDPEVYLRCIGFANGGNVGWAGTLSPPKILFSTRSGGNTWSEVANLPANAPSAICGLSVVNENVVYMSGTNFPNRPPRMMRTLDGGGTWNAWDMRPWASILIDTFFVTAERGWVVGGKTDEPVATRNNVKAIVLFTDDGGKTWVNRAAGLAEQLPKGEWGWKIQFLDDRIGFVSLESFSAGAILKTTDGGNSWMRIEVNDPQRNANLEGVGFLDQNHGWVGGWGDAAFQRLSTSETIDGGRTWRDANQVGRALNRFRFFGKPVTFGYASGQTVYRYSKTPTVPAAVATGPRQGRLLADYEPLYVRGQIRLPIAVPEAARRLTVRIWDRFGELVDTLVDEPAPTSGPRTVEWHSSIAARGHFIVRVTVDNVSESRIVHVTSAS